MVSLIVACVAKMFLCGSVPLDLDAGRRAIDVLGAIPAVLVTDARFCPSIFSGCRATPPLYHVFMFLHGWLAAPTRQHLLLSMDLWR